MLVLFVLNASIDICLFLNLARLGAILFVSVGRIKPRIKYGAVLEG